ncbi:hypothetical protein F5B20DRAFT_252387 [Whalleya microplaca]|nr:hypothetical protein F5B20DRAFT_252387 [Whalleya microplaca]
MIFNNAVDQALGELGTSRGKAWNIGMDLPPGKIPSLNYGKKGKTDGGYPPTSTGYGKNWVGDYPTEDNSDWNDFARGGAIEGIVNSILKLTTLRHVWIIFANHDKKYCYDEDGRRIPIYENGKRKWKMEPADEHITVRFGTDENKCMLHGHIYVTVDEQKVPTGLMKEGTRKYITNGDERILELWEYTGAPNAKPFPIGPDARHNKAPLKKILPRRITAQDRYRKRDAIYRPTKPCKPHMYHHRNHKYTTVRY